MPIPYAWMKHDTENHSFQGKVTHHYRNGQSAPGNCTQQNQRTANNKKRQKVQWWQGNVLVPQNTDTSSEALFPGSEKFEAYPTHLRPHTAKVYIYILESRRRRTKRSVVREEWCQNAAPLRWYTKNFFAQSKMILSRAWLHDTAVSCAAWNDARKGVYLKPLFKTPCSNCYWRWSKPIMLDYRGDISLMESVPLLWRTVTASPVGIEPMTILEGGGPVLWTLSVYLADRVYTRLTRCCATFAWLRKVWGRARLFIPRALMHALAAR